MWMWYFYDYVRHQWWVSMTVYGWDGGAHITDDFGNLIKVAA